MSLDHCALALPWFVVGGSPSLARLHRLAIRLDWSNAPSPELRAWLWITSLGWPVVSLAHVAIQLHWNAGYVAKSQGVSRWRQASEMLYLANRYNCPPSSYYKFSLFDPDKARRVSQYLHHYEICNLLPQLNTGRPVHLVGNKREFCDEAQRHGLPVAPIIATFNASDAIRWHSGPEGNLPQCDLVLKAFDLSCGIHFECWSYTGNRTWSNGTDSVTEQGLIDRCRGRSRDHGCLVQRRLVNHPGIAALVGKGLCTVRVVTYRRPGNRPAPLLSSFRMPTGEGVVDNFAAGGIASPVDLPTGTLGPAVAKNLSRGIFLTHPDSGHQIAGERLPFWREILQLTLTAHQCFDWMPFVGWDVAITPDGPVLLEANPTWCVDLLQIPRGAPLGDTEFSAIFVEHLDAGDPTGTVGPRAAHLN
jgi:hypothetical protein